MSIDLKRIEEIKDRRARITAPPWHAPGLGEVHSDHDSGVYVRVYGEDDPRHGSDECMVADGCSENDADFITGKSYSFKVFGIARPAGSKQAFVPLHPKTKEPYRRKGGGIVVSVVNDNPQTKQWIKHVSKTAREEYSGPYLTGFVSLECVFYLPRPKSHYGSGANEHRVKPSAPAMPGVKPDHDKLLRAVSDGLTQALNVYRDDAQIVDGIARKRYGTPRVEITISEVICGPDENQQDLFEKPAPWDSVTKGE